MKQLLKSFCHTFLTGNTIHGLNHLAYKRRHPLETFTWFILIALSVYAVSILSSVALRHYTENPTVISMERDRFSWNTSFPTATVCPSNKLNRTRLEEFVEERSNVTNATVLREFLVKLSEAGYDSFGELPLYEEINSESYMEILLDLAFNFKPSVTNSGISNMKMDLQKTITEMGICYTFNSQLAVYNSPEYWKNDSWNLLPEEQIFYVNPLDGDVFVSLMNMYTGVNVNQSTKIFPKLTNVFRCIYMVLTKWLMLLQK